VLKRASGRGVVFLPAAALLVHQLRYWLTYGAQASNELSGTGHGYLDNAVPWIVMVTAAGVGTFAVRRRVGARRSFVERWLGAAVLLLALFTVQETLEGLFATGHPGGFAAVFGHGGWWAVPVVLVVAFLLALLLRVADALARTADAPPARRGAVLLFAPVAVASLRTHPLATAAAGRAPPVLQ
jgi:hypothetical protein